jgi:hypothetical protein
VDITLKGEADPLQVTATHQLWSLDQAGWVEAGDLKPGEQLAGENGPVTVESVTQDCQPIAVYNLDVDVDHQYLVTDLGALAHNVYPDDYDFTVPANYSGYQYSQYLDFTENDNGVYLNDLASGGQLGEIESIAGYGQALPGAPATGSPPKPDFTVEWQDGTTGYGDLYQPTGSEEGVTNEIISKLDQQTAGGAVFVRISSNAKSGATAMYRQAAQNALESSTSGRAVIVVKGNSVLQMFFR